MPYKMTLGSLFDGSGGFPLAGALCGMTPVQKHDMTDEEYRFWMDVRRAKEAASGRTPREYTKHQIVRWYGKLHTDSAEYKMWGNGVALPCAAFVLKGLKQEWK